MLKSVVKAALRPAWIPIKSRMIQYVDSRAAEQSLLIRDLDRALKEVQETVRRSAETERSWSKQNDILTQELNHLRWEVRESRYSFFCPDPADNPVDGSLPAFEFSNCQASDFYHPRYAQMCRLINERPRFHRKQWEFAFVLHKLIESGAVAKDARGLVFGVGREPLPAVFASMGVNIVATDAPRELDSTSMWANTNQYGAELSTLSYPAITPDEVLAQRVTHGYCDMNNIDPGLRDFDFNWSSCCFEHLGSLEAGLQFVVNAVEKTLKVGGVAVHTTEFNASSNDKTVESGDTVVYRRRDMEALVQRLRERGHHVEDFKIGPMAHALDYHVDVPPYVQDLHLKLRIAGYACTSVGLVIRRGR